MKALKKNTKYTIPSGHSSDQAWATRMTDFGNAVESLLCQLKSVCLCTSEVFGRKRQDCFILLFPQPPRPLPSPLPKTNFSCFHFLHLQDYSLAVKTAKFPAKQTCILVTCFPNHLHLVLPADLSWGMNRAYLLSEKTPGLVSKPVGQQNVLFCLVCGRLGSV